MNLEVARSSFALQLKFRPFGTLELFGAKILKFWKPLNYSENLIPKLHYDCSREESLVFFLTQVVISQLTISFKTLVSDFAFNEFEHQLQQIQCISIEKPFLVENASLQGTRNIKRLRNCKAISFLLKDVKVSNEKVIGSREPLNLVFFVEWSRCLEKL